MLNVRGERKLLFRGLKGIRSQPAMSERSWEDGILACAWGIQRDFWTAKWGPGKSRFDLAAKLVLHRGLFLESKVLSRQVFERAT